MKVLIPVQDNIFGDAITDFITGHKWGNDTQFKLLTVVEYTTYGEMLGEMYCCETTRAVYDRRMAEATSLLEEYASKIDHAVPGTFVRHKIAYGRPKNVILHEAEEWGADMIVMGSHARTGMSRFLLGSVSMAVLGQSPCSVVIVKLPPAQQAAPKEKHAAQDQHKHAPCSAQHHQKAAV